MADSDPDKHTEPNSEGPWRGVPAVGRVVPGRFSSDEVFQRIVADADHEITSGNRELFFSALAGGFAITITFLLYASMSATTDSSIVAAALYPLGFVYIIIGGYQLYTENTLPPVALTLERLASIPALFRHWLVVLAGNFAGGLIGAIVLAYSGVFDANTAIVAAELAQKGIETPAWDLFFKGAFAGLIVAGVVWMDFASRDTISRLVIVYLAFLAIPLGNLFHVVVSFTEAMYLLFVGDLSIWIALSQFVIPVLLGNTIGGVLLVTVVNYYQTSDRRLEVERFQNVRRLTPREWILGNLAGRSYVPVVDTIEDVVRDPDSYTVLVPIANPRTETRMVDLACTIASERTAGAVHAVHIVQTPRRSFPSSDGHHHDRVIRESNRVMKPVRRTGERYDIEFETSTIVTSLSFEAIFDRARRTRPDLVVMGWGGDRVWESARAERPLDELTNRLPCDFLVVKGRELDWSRVLLSTAGGPDSDLSAEIARTLHTAHGSQLSLLHVVDGPAERDAGRRFLTEWATERGLDDADLIVDDSGDVESAIEREAKTRTAIMLGATERGLLSRLVTDSLHFDVVNDVECSVLLAERPSTRSIRERLFGVGRRQF